MLPKMRRFRPQGRVSVIRRRLAFLVVLALVVFIINFYLTIEASYLDLVDSFMWESSVITTDAVRDIISQPFSTNLHCKDGSGWLEEWISSGVMPKCSLAHRSKVDVLYTYFVFLRQLISDG
jgi:hypothetical protein